LSDPYRLQTPENVAVSYDLAGVGSRFLAAVVDTLLQTVLILLIYLAEFVAGGWIVASGALRDLGQGEPTAGVVWLIALFLLASFVLLWGYYIAFELLWNGQTPGKRLFRLRVLRDSGYPIGFLDSLIRNLVRVIDFLPLFYGIGVLTMLIDARSRRLGDLAAGTIVVKERRGLRATELLLDTPPPADALAAEEVPNLDRLSGRDYSLLREYLLRREGLAADARAALARELSQALARRLDTAPPEDAPAADAFLARVAAAYRARHEARRGTYPASPPPGAGRGSR
jgi:uncharacterized RDD family membrane protein YckC